MCMMSDHLFLTTCTSAHLARNGFTVEKNVSVSSAERLTPR